MWPILPPARGSVGAGAEAAGETVAAGPLSPWVPLPQAFLRAGPCGYSAVTLCHCTHATPRLVHLEVGAGWGREKTGWRRKEKAYQFNIFLRWVVLCCSGLQNFNYYFDAGWLPIARPDLVACLHKVRQRLLLLHFRTAREGGSFTLRRKLCG